MNRASLAIVAAMAGIACGAAIASGHDKAQPNIQPQSSEQAIRDRIKLHGSSYTDEMRRGLAAHIRAMNAKQKREGK